MDREWKLGDDLILAVHHNCRTITPGAVRKELKEMLAPMMQDMRFLLEKNMSAIMKEAGKGRGQ